LRSRLVYAAEKSLTVFKHGTDAEIKPGTPFTAFVDADTSLPPAQ